jgi:hypothetical protein
VKISIISGITEGGNEYGHDDTIDICIKKETRLKI